MSSRDSRERLDRLVAVLRAQPPPAPPGELPARLRAEFRRVAAARWPASVAASAAQRRTQRRRGGSLWLPGLAAAAVLGWASAFVAGRFVDALPRQEPAASVLAVLEGAPLALGTAVTALEQPRRVEHPGRASWVLAPGSQGRVLSAASGVLRVALERGSLDAEVQPSSGASPADLARGTSLAESFIVEAQGTEVAVHGTRFRVTLSGERTAVAVSQGQVVVRPLGQLAGTTLGAGMSGEFRAGVVAPSLPAAAVSAPASGPSASAPTPAPSLAGGFATASPGQRRGSLRLGRAALPAEGRPAASAASAPESAGSRSEPSAAPWPSPSSATPAAVVEPALHAITERVQSCFRRHTGPSDLGIEVSTELVFWVESSGELLQADFEPPLAPAVEACVAAELGQLRLAPSPQGYRVERQLRLHR